jgi:hypothetical protein
MLSPGSLGFLRHPNGLDADGGVRARFEAFALKKWSVYPTISPSVHKGGAWK